VELKNARTVSRQETILNVTKVVFHTHVPHIATEAMADSTESASPIVQLISPEDQQQIVYSKVDDAVPSVDAVADAPATSFVLEGETTVVFK